MNNISKEAIIHSESSCDLYKKTIEFIGKRWTGIIIFNLFTGPKRYHELLHAIDGISDRLLTERLKDLEQEGLLTKRIIEESPRKVEYELTPPGHEFKDVCMAILGWAERKEEFTDKNKQR